MRSPTFIIKGWNALTQREENIRSSGNAIKTTEEANERIHAGKMFTYTEIASLANLEESTILIVPNSGTDIHLKGLDVKASGTCSLKLYEGAFYNVDSLGTDVSSLAVNHNRQLGSAVRDFNIYKNSYFDVNSLGQRLFEDEILDVAKRAGGRGEGVPLEYVLEPAQTYLIRLTNDSGAAETVVIRYSMYDAEG